MSADNANAVLSVFAEKVITRLFNAIDRQFGYIFFYKTNINNLVKRVLQLENLRVDVECFFKEQRWNNVERAQSSAGWLNDVEEVTIAANRVVESKYKLNGCCVNIKKRYGLSKKSTRLVAMIQTLQDQAPKKVAIHQAPPAAMLPGATSSEASKDFKSRRDIMDKVMEALKDDKVNIIGICGLGGIGKTTILHEVRERARTQKLFDEVAITTLSQVTNVFEIQKNLAGMLGLTSIQQVDDVIARANLLHRRLTNGSTILIVLDDIWSEIRLEDVGIPIENDRARCKVVLASRNESVCASMGAQITIPVDVLSKEEAWHMFEKAAGDCIEREKLQNIAKEIANECGGLPIALLTLARTLSNKNKRAWEDARRQLRQSSVTRIPEMNKKVYSTIMLSYNFLASEFPEAQPLLLICCQHRDDDEIEVEKLARYCLALELFKNVDKLADARNITYTLIDHLKSCFLLQAVDIDEEGIYDKVKMHDVIRDVFLSIVSEVKEERDKVYMHIMTKDTSDHKLGSSEVDYPKLKLLMVETPYDDGVQDIKCLQQMEQLRVLEVCETEENCDLQSALQVLENLRMLCIEDQPISDDIMSLIGSLSRLKILSFLGSEVSSFPRQIGQLCNLKLLDLRGSRSEEGLIPSGILPRFNKLEVLCMGKFLLLGTGEDKDIKNRESYGHIKELESLSDLTTLQINLVNADDLLQCFCLENLESFLFISKSDTSYAESRLLAGKSIYFLEAVGMKWVLDAKIQFIVRSTLALRLKKINGWDDPFILKEFVSLNELYLIECNQLEYVIPEGSLANLRILRLSSMPNLRRLWMGPIDPLCLVNLTKIEFYWCEKIETIFPHSTAKSLVQLQELSIVYCFKLKGIFSKGELGTTSSSAAEIKKDFILLLPKLRMVYLKGLSNFKGFYDLNIDDGKAQQPFINPVIILPSLKLLNCSFGDCHVKQIVGGGVLELSKLVACNWLQNLESLIVHWCHSVNTLFDFEGLDFTGENAQVLTLDGLKYINLWDLPKLEHLFCKIPRGIHSFHNLQELKINTCQKLGYLISSSMAHMLVNLKLLVIEKCKSMQEVIKMDEDGGKNIFFRFLTTIKLQDMENLSSFCSDDRQSIEFPSLEEVVIYKCPKMKTFSCGHLTAQKVKRVNLKEFPSSDEDILVSKADLNEMVRHLNERVYKMGSDIKEDDGPERGIADKYADECNTDEGTPNEAPMLISVVSSPTVSLTPDVVSPSSPVSDNHEEFANSSTPDLRKDALPPLIEFVPSSSTEQSIHSSNDSLVQPKADKELYNMSSSSRADSGSSSSIRLEQGTPKISLMPLSYSENNEEFVNSSTPDVRKAALPHHIESVQSSTDSRVQSKADTELSHMSLSNQDDEWKRNQILVQGVYVKSEWKTTFEEILTAKPNFLSTVRLKMARMQTDVVESAIRSLQILRQHTALTISSEELTYIKDSLNDLETSGLDTAWLERGYQRAIVVIKEQEAVSVSAKLVRMEREKMEDEAKLEASTARLDAIKAEYNSLMQELEVGKELSGGGFDLETCLGDGLLD